MKKILFMLIAFAVFHNLNGQTTEPETTLRKQKTDSIEGWKKGGNISINLTQASFKNWSAGGQNSIAVNGLLSTFANYKKGNSSWDNMLDMGYGLLHQGKDEVIKTDDKIDLSSKYGYALSKKMYTAFLASFKTQMAKGYNYPNDTDVISDFLSPGYLLGAAGLDYRPNDDLSVFLAPLTGRITIVNNQMLADAGSYGVEAATYDDNGVLLSHGSNILTEFGGYTRITYKHLFFKDESVGILTKLDLFSNYIRNPQNIDVSWETIITLKVNKYISANITTHLLYDDDTDIDIDSNEDGITDESGPRLQFKQVLGIGFSYKF